ncbi:hypothetical protein CDD82_509 [Ophiocordyceps australis]|uniref:Zn(2)-C6 fungal-type domain-containing protein n=1 Tax=Ophiocordyceps australis TaxID=1399860 RepID=A0A2C5YNK2_9HYPO|nr:hypothetical protein CDD82_509 [Ophiocordyceps australis]
MDELAAHGRQKRRRTGISTLSACGRGFRLSYDDSIRQAHAPGGLGSSYAGSCLPCDAISLCQCQTRPAQDASLQSPFSCWLDIGETQVLGPIVLAHGSQSRSRAEAWLEPDGCAYGATGAYLGDSMNHDAGKANTGAAAPPIPSHVHGADAFKAVWWPQSPESSSTSNSGPREASSSSSSVSSEPLDSAALDSAALQNHHVASLASSSPPRLTKTSQDPPWPPGAQYLHGQLQYSATAPASASLAGLCATEPPAWDPQPPLTDHVHPASSSLLGLGPVCDAPTNATPTYAHAHDALQPPLHAHLDHYPALDPSLGTSHAFSFIDPYSLFPLDLIDASLYSPDLLSLPQVADMTAGVIIPRWSHCHGPEQSGPPPAGQLVVYDAQQQDQGPLGPQQTATLEPDEQPEQQPGTSSLACQGQQQHHQSSRQAKTNKPEPRLPESDAVEVDFDSISLDGFQLVSKRKRNEPAPTDKEKPAKSPQDRAKNTCLRCRVQKLRCNTRDNSTECDACRQFSKTSRKTIHHIACHRGKLIATVLFRQGGLNLTKRWQGTDIKDVGDRFQNSQARTICVTLDLCKEPLVIDVVPFCPAQDDVQDRFWHARDAQGRLVAKGMRLPAYCLESACQTAVAFEKYVLENALVAMVQESLQPNSAGMRGLSTDLFSRTYNLAIDHYIKLGPSTNSSLYKLATVERSMLANLILLWFATRHTTGSAYIIGPDTLGMGPELLDKSYPLYNKVSLPRMVTAQFDSIIHKQILTKYGRRVLQDLEALMFSNKRCYWWSIYVCVFIFLREASLITADRYRHARSNFGTKQLRYTIPDFVEELQDSCNNLLMHWHYYNCKPWPDASKPAQRRQYPFLSDVQCQLIRDTIANPDIQHQLSIWKCYKEDNGCK